MQAGAFKGDWSNHRHDMACGSMIAWLMNMDKNYVERRSAPGVRALG